MCRSQEDVLKNEPHKVCISLETPWYLYLRIRVSN